MKNIIMSRKRDLILTLLVLLLGSNSIFGGYTAKQISILKEGADKHDYACLHNLAVAYFYGDGVPKDYNLAISYGIRANTIKSTNSVKLLIASAYWATGKYRDAQKWAKEANGGAAYIEGEAYYQGMGIEKNPFMALFNYCHNMNVSSKYYQKDLAFHQLRMSQILKSIADDYAKGYSNNSFGTLYSLSNLFAKRASEGMALYNSNEGTTRIKRELNDILNTKQLAPGLQNVYQIKLEARKINYTDNTAGYYIGERVEDKRTGFGLLYNSEESYSIGWFNEGKLNGEGIRRSDHEIHAGLFKDGKLFNGRIWLSRDESFCPWADYKNGKFLRTVKLLGSGQMSNKGGRIANAVDLGLSIRWADTGVALSGTSDFLFGWGCTNPKLIFQSQHSQDSPYKYLPPKACYAIYGGNANSPKHDISGSNMDASTTLWNPCWHLPTKAQVEELLARCSFRVVGDNVIVLGPNGNSITLKISGVRTPSGLQTGIGGFWCSEADEEAWLSEDMQEAWGVLIDPQSEKLLTKKTFLKETGLMVWPVAISEAE